MRASVRIIHNGLDKLPGYMQAQASQAVRKAALDIEAGAKQIVPVDTGALKNSIQTVNRGALSARVQTGVEYAPFVEYGTRRRTAKPYLRPAVEAVKPAFLAAMKQITKGAA